MSCSASEIRVGDVTMSLPSEVRVERLADGRVLLNFDSFTGSIALSPLLKRSVSEELPSQAELVKRARLETPEDSEASAPAAISAMRTVPQEVFRNGGLSQDSDDGDEGPAPRAISWDEAAAAAPPPPPPEAAAPEFAAIDDPPWVTAAAAAAAASSSSPGVTRAGGASSAPPSADSRGPPSGGIGIGSSGSSVSRRSAKSANSAKSAKSGPPSSGKRSAASSASGGAARGKAHAALSPPVSALLDAADAMDTDADTDAVGTLAGAAAVGLEVGGEAAAGLTASISPERLARMLQQEAAGAASTAVVAVAASSSSRDAVAAEADGGAYPFSRAEKLDVWEWEPVRGTGTLPTPRWGHCCAVLGGAVYVMGGDDLTDSDDDILRDLYRLDTASGEWKRCRDAPHGRCWHSGTVVGGSVQGNSDILLVFGGETLKSGSDTRVPLNTMLSYDPEFEVWYDAVDRGTRPSARLGHAAVLHTANGDGASEKLLVFGGWSGRKYAEPELRELHIGSDWAWRRVLSGGTPPLARAYHTATHLSHERLLIFGGHDGELRTFKAPHVLDLSCMAWHHPEVKGTPPAPRTGHVATCLDGSRVMIHGGWEPQVGSSGLGLAEEAYKMHSDVFLLDTDSWVWSRPKMTGPPPCGRVGHSLVPHVNAEDGSAALYVFGGRAEGEKPLNDTYRLRPVAQ